MIQESELDAYAWLAIPVWVFNKKSLRIDWANEAALKFWGAKSVDALRARNFDDVTLVTRARLDKVHAAALEGRYLEEQWTLYPLGHPKTVVLQSNVVVSALGSTDGILLIANNLKAVPDATLRGVQVLLYTPVLAASYSLLGEVLYRNPAAALAWDRLSTDGGRLSPFEATFVDPDMSASVIESIRNGQGFSSEVRMNTCKGERFFAVDARPVNDPVDGALSIELSARDVTDYKCLERERDLLRETQVQTERAKLRDAQADALTEKRRSAAARKLFMATASHELRTPLQTIIGCVDLLEQQPAEVRYCLSELRDAADQMGEIAADLVEFVRADHAPGVSVRKVDVRAFLERALAAPIKDATRKGLRFDTDLTRLPPTVGLDEKRVRQVVSNLAMNAVKYTPQGSVSVSASVTENESSPVLVVVIADTGVGMHDGLASKVLQPFVRGPNSAEIDPQGFGMGLAIVQSHLTELGGTLDIESAPGVGTSITVSVPCTLVKPQD